MGADHFSENGTAVVEAVVPPEQVAGLCGIDQFASGDAPGARSIFTPVAVARLVSPEGELTSLAERLAGHRMRPVRILYFDKNPRANWAVPWHQDRRIAVSHRVDTPGYRIWTIKGGVHHVEPPETILRSMISVRLHLDDCGPHNGPLLTLRSSFLLGRVVAGEVRRHVETGVVDVCNAKAGDVVAMRGLTIHASERALQPSCRRVIHVDFNSADLPGELEWAMGH